MTFGSLAHRLRITYGLTNDPDDAQMAEWAKRVEHHIQQGTDSVTAGRTAALEAFGELEAILYFSQADTIASLLAQARATSQSGE